MIAQQRSCRIQTPTGTMQAQIYEVNAQQAFMRDKGEWYDPALALYMYQKARDFLQRSLR